MHHDRAVRPDCDRRARGLSQHGRPSTGDRRTRRPRTDDASTREVGDVVSGAPLRRATGRHADHHGPGPTGVLGDLTSEILGQWLVGEEALEEHDGGEVRDGAHDATVFLDDPDQRTRQQRTRQSVELFAQPEEALCVSEMQYSRPWRSRSSRQQRRRVDRRRRPRLGRPAVGGQGHQRTRSERQTRHRRRRPPLERSTTQDRHTSSSTSATRTHWASSTPTSTAPRSTSVAPTENGSN